MSSKNLEVLLDATIDLIIDVVFLLIYGVVVQYILNEVIFEDLNISYKQSIGLVFILRLAQFRKGN